MRGKFVVVLMLTFGFSALALALIFLRPKPGEKLGISTTDRVLGPEPYWSEARLHLIGKSRTLHLAGDGRVAQQWAIAPGSVRSTRSIDPLKARALFGALVAADVMKVKPTAESAWRLVLVNSSREVREVALPEPLPVELRAALAPVLELDSAMPIGTPTGAPSFESTWRPF